MMFEKSGKWVSFDSDKRIWGKHAILHFKSILEKQWKNDVVKWNVFETQPNSWKWLNIGKSGKWVSLDSDIRMWVKDAILHFNAILVKQRKNDVVKWNVFETQPKSLKWLNIVRKEWEMSFVRLKNKKVSKISYPSFQVNSRKTMKEWYCKMKCFRNATKLLEMT